MGQRTRSTYLKGVGARAARPNRRQVLLRGKGHSRGPDSSGARSTTLALSAVPPATRAATGTIKGLAWKLLYANHRAELGPDGWAELTKRTGGPADVKALGLADDVPVGPFNAALAHLEQTLGPQADAREAGARLVERWAQMYRALVRELEGDPGRAIELFCREVHPWFVADPDGARLDVHDEGRARVNFDDGLPPRFRAGLLEGFARLTGADPTLVAVDERTVELTWPTIEPATPSPAALFVRATRLRLVSITLVPLVVGTALAWWTGTVDAALAALALAAAASLHLAANTLNDLADHARGIDQANLTPTPFGGGSRVLQRGLVSSRAMLALTALFTLAGVAIGLALVAEIGLPILALGAAGVALGYAYTGSPFRLAHRGLGELAALVVFGPLLTAGAYAVQAGVVTVGSLVAGLPVGLLMAATLYLNEMPDAPWDARTGKRTLVVRLGERASMGLAALLALSYASLGTAVLAGALPALALLGVATAPLAAVIARRVDRAQGDADALAALQPFMLVVHGLTGALVALGLALEVLA